MYKRQALAQAREARLQILDVMNATISEARPEVGETAPKIASFQIPLDRIGEVIGPKGKVINTIQQETGADIAVDDDGTVGTVTIGSPDGRKVEAAKERIMLIIDPPTANVGEVYTGKVVNITKFGAFVNILPGRDGLVHISKLGRGKRINRVEDVVDLGDEIVVRVDEIDDRGKVSLSPVGDDTEADASGEESAPQAERSSGPGRAANDAAEVSFEDAFDAEAREVFGDLGPETATASSGDGGRRDGDRRRRHR